MRYAFAPALIIAAFGLGACSGTTMHTTWAGPQPSRMAFQHPLVLFVSRDAAIRRAAEDRMASEIPGALQSYAVIPDETLQDKEQVKKLIRDAGYDGVVVMRLAAVQEGVGNVPVIPAANFAGTSGNWMRDRDLWGYWGTSWSRVYSPDYYYNDQLVTVESAVYNTNDGELLWAGQSQTLNPSSLKSLIKSVVHKSVKEMKEHGLSA